MMILGALALTMNIIQANASESVDICKILIEGATKQKRLEHSEFLRRVEFKPRGRHASTSYGLWIPLPSDAEHEDVLKITNIKEHTIYAHFLSVWYGETMILSTPTLNSAVPWKGMIFPRPIWGGHHPSSTGIYAYANVSNRAKAFQEIQAKVQYLIGFSNLSQVLQVAGLVPSNDIQKFKGDPSSMPSLQLPPGITTEDYLQTHDSMIKILQQGFQIFGVPHSRSRLPIHLMINLRSADAPLPTRSQQQEIQWEMLQHPHIFHSVALLSKDAILEIMEDGTRIYATKNFARDPSLNFQND